jgi:hypothetical protein
MGISIFPTAAAAAFGSDDFELISSVTPTAASTSVNFTSLDPFKKLLVICKDVELATTGIIRIRLNNDSNGDNYLYNYFSTSANINAAFGTGFQATTTNTVSQTVRFLLIENCDKTGVKIATAGAARIGSDYTQNLNQLYLGTAIITQLNVVSSTTFTAAGTVALYGVR